MFGFLKNKSKSENEHFPRGKEKGRRNRRDRKRKSENSEQKKTDDSLKQNNSQPNTRKKNENSTKKDQSVNLLLNSSSGPIISQSTSNSSSRTSIPSISTDCDSPNSIKITSTHHDQHSKRNCSTNDSSSKEELNSEISNRTGLLSKPPLTPRSIRKKDRALWDDRGACVDGDDTSISSSILNSSLCDLSTNSNLIGSSSMLSTPSSSTSSLSSLSLHSGRKTPPGPRMGTAVRLGSSPIPARKVQRLNIKTNPKASSPIITPKSPHLTLNSQSYCVPKRNCNNISDVMSVPLEKTISSSSTTENILPVKNHNGPTKLKSSMSSSVYSLESIPEMQHEASPFNKPDKAESPTSVRDNADILNTLIGESVKNLRLIKEEVSDSQKEKLQVNQRINNDKSSGVVINLDKQSLLPHGSTIPKSLLETENINEDDELSVSLREPEVTEHRLELVPNRHNLEASMFCSKERIPEYTKPNNADHNENTESSTVSETSECYPEPTCAVFQIPLRSKSCSRERTGSPNRISAEKDSPEPHVEGDEETTSDTIPPECTVKGHMELNFERGRTRDTRSKNSPRRRSLSSVRRQKLYDDIKKFTAETKDINLKRNSIEEYPLQWADSKRLSDSYSKTGPNFQSKTNNLKEVSKYLKEKDADKLTHQMSIPEEFSSYSPKKSSLSPIRTRRSSPKKLERSITVAEIKINVNNSNQEDLIRKNKNQSKSLSRESLLEKVIQSQSSQKEELQLVSKLTEEGEAKSIKTEECESTETKCDEMISMEVHK